jgi:PKD repeat protein
VPVKTFTAAGTYNVLLTVTDEWKATGTTTVPVTVTEPSGNVAPTPTFKTSCLALTCSVSSTGTVDSNTGDVITYSWNWGDGTPPSSGATPVAHRYAQAGEYTITLTATDGWGRSARTTRVVTRTEPVDNAAPTAAFSSACSGLVCQMNSNATSDPNGDQLIYSWAWGDNTAGGTTANPSHTYAGAGTYTITLTVRDGWDKVGTTTRRVTLP